MVLASFGTATISAPEPVVVELDLTKPEDVEIYIANEAVKKQFSPVLAVAIADAESDFYPNAVNPSGDASGVYQFLNSTFRDYCIKQYKLTDTMEQKNDVRIQVECALTIMTTDAKGIGHWNASKSEWGPSQGG